MASEVPSSFVPQDGRGARRLRLVFAGAVLIALLAGCVPSPEAARVPGEPGADVGNQGSPVELLAPPDRFERIYFEIPYVGPSVAQPDVSES